jgi:hypothetical protein
VAIQLQPTSVPPLLPLLDLLVQDGSPLIYGRRDACIQHLIEGIKKAPPLAVVLQAGHHLHAAR